MNLAAANKLAYALLNAHGLRPKWGFRFDRAHRRFGACHWRKSLITLSESLILANEEPVVRNTLLHEIAHALTGRQAGHGPQWKRVAQSIGCTGERCYGAEVVRAYKVEGICPHCGHRVKQVSRSRTACKRCCDTYNHGAYSPHFAFIWSPL